MVWTSVEQVFTERHISHLVFSLPPRFPQATWADVQPQPVPGVFVPELGPGQEMEVHSGVHRGSAHGHHIANPADVARPMHGKWKKLCLSLASCGRVAAHACKTADVHALLADGWVEGKSRS